MQDNIYVMKLHESIGFDDFRITRVPRGWIYSRTSQLIKSNNGSIEGIALSDTFVPYDNEFQKEVK